MSRIVQRDADEQRFRRKRVEEIRPIDAARQRRHDVLLRVICRTRRLDVGLRKVFRVAHRDNGGADPAVEGTEELCHRGPAGLTAASDSIGIHFRPRQQVVNPANTIPRAEQSEVGTKQDQPTPGVLVFARTSAVNG